MRKSNFDAIVIGGGAAGMLASAVAAERGLSVLLLEKNERLGKKLRITGKGRCNVTNACNVKTVIENTPTGGKFLYSALNAFPPEKTMQMFEKMGVPLKTERGNRVFPVSDKAQDIVDALRRRLIRAGASVEQTAAEEIMLQNGRVSGVKTAKGYFSAPCILLCTGGASYPATGSDGSGYRLAAKVGHRVLAPRASLVPLEARGEDCGSMQGFSLRNIGLRVTDGGKKPVYEDFGELLFTHFGVSGPLALSASAHMRDYDNKKYVFHIDLKPALDEKTLDARILRDFAERQNKDFANSLDALAGRSMIPVLVKRSGIEPTTKVHSITKEQRQGLVRLLKDFTVEIAGTRPVDEAIVTSGGVDTGEINPRTMESKLVPGLYFAGEVLNCDAYTGGFNLQIAWSTAMQAALHMELPANEEE